MQGGEKKFYAALCEMIEAHQPKAAFVYATCIVGVIGDDVDAVCKRVSLEKGIPVLAVHSEGFKGTKKDGYKRGLRCAAAIHRNGADRGYQSDEHQHPGRLQPGGETWMIRKY